MAFVYTGETYNQIEVNYTKEALRGIIRTDKDAFTPYYFSFADPDTNYALASTASTVTTYTNVLLRGEVPSLTGNDSATSTDSCVNVLNNSTYDPSKGIKRGEIDNYDESCQPGFIPIQLDLSLWDESNPNSNTANNLIDPLSILVLGIDITEYENGPVNVLEAAIISSTNNIFIKPPISSNDTLEDIGDKFISTAIGQGYADSFYDLSDDILTIYLNRNDVISNLSVDDDSIAIVINERFIPDYINGRLVTFNVGSLAVIYQSLTCRWDYTGLYDNFGS